MATYHGWIPNVVGRLSYSIAGAANYPSKVRFAGDLSDAGTHFLGYQRRNLSDTSIPFLSEWRPLHRLIDKHIYAKDGNFVFVCYMRHRKTEDSLSGKVSFFRDKDWPRPREHIKTMLKLIQSSPDVDLRIDDRIGRRIRPYAVAIARFTIQRNGVLDLTPEKMPTDGDLASPFADIEQTVCSQLYFFLRDLLHTHKFHAGRTDKILDIYKEDWKRSVNYSLARKAIHLRRSKRPSTLQRALGVVSYLQSFRQNVMDEAERSALPFSLDHFVASTKDYLPLANEENDRRWAARVTRLLRRTYILVAAIVGVAVTFGRNAKMLGDQHEYIDWIFSWINTQLLSVLLIMMLVIPIAEFIVSDKVFFRDDVIRNNIRQAVYFRRKRFGAATLMLSALLLYLGAWLLVKSAVLLTG